jgi:hypothetical protein
MMVGATLRLGLSVCVALVGLAVPTQAQVPGPPGWADPIACACLKQALDAASADMAARMAALNEARAELDRLDQQLAAARASVNVDDPQSVAQFRQLLAQRDAAFQRSTGAIFADAHAATLRYNAVTADFNNQCTGRPLPPPPPGPLSCPPR